MVNVSFWPLVAAKYAIVVMTMLFAVSGMAAALFLPLNSKRNGTASGNFES